MTNLEHANNCKIARNAAVKPIAVLNAKAVVAAEFHRAAGNNDAADAYQRVSDLLTEAMEATMIADLASAAVQEDIMWRTGPFGAESDGTN
jgi:hypothetical protein